MANLADQLERLEGAVVRALTPPPPPEITYRVMKVDRGAKIGDLRMGSARVRLPIDTQELADALAVDVAAGRTPTVVIQNRRIVRRSGNVSALAAAGPSAVIGAAPTATLLPAPIIVAARGDTLGVYLRWEPLVGAVVIGYRVSVLGADGVTTLRSLDADAIEAVITGIADGPATARVQAIGSGGIAGEWSATQTVDVQADTVAPDPPNIVSHSWSQAEPGLDLVVSWDHPPTIPPDFAGYAVEVRAIDNTVRWTTLLDGLQRSVTYPYSLNRAHGLSPALIVAVRSRDTHGNLSPTESITALYPALPAPTAPATLASTFRQVGIALPAAPIRAVQTRLAIQPTGEIRLLAAGQTTTTLFGTPGAAYTVTYQWIDAFDRLTASSPASQITVGTHEIGFDDLGVLEQVRLASTNMARTATELRNLIDGNQTTLALVNTSGQNETISFTYPLARQIAGITIYVPNAAIPVTAWIQYTTASGQGMTLGSNSTSDHTVAGSLNDVLLREYTGATSGAYLSITPQLVGGRYQVDLRFGDAAAAATRVYKPITTDELRLTIGPGLQLCEIVILTYEAAQVLAGRMLRLSDGLEIRSGTGSSGFQMTPAAISGYSAAGEQVHIDSADGRLRAGPVVLDAVGIAIPASTNLEAGRAYRFVDSGGLTLSHVQARADATTNELRLDQQASGSAAGKLEITSRANGSAATSIRLSVSNQDAAALLTLNQDGLIATVAQATIGAGVNAPYLITNGSGTAFYGPLTINADALRVSGSTAAYAEFYTVGSGGARKGYIGIGDPSANDLYIASDLAHVIMAPAGSVGVGRTPSAAGARLDVASGIGINGLKVVGPRGAAVAAPAATVGDCQRAINDLVARLQAHGLIS